MADAADLLDQLRVRIAALRRWTVAGLLASLLAVACAIASALPATSDLLPRGDQGSHDSSFPDAHAEVPAALAALLDQSFLNTVSFYHVPNAQDRFPGAWALVLMGGVLAAIGALYLFGAITGWRKRWAIIPVLLLFQPCMSGVVEGMRYAEFNSITASATRVVQVRNVDDPTPGHVPSWRPCRVRDDGQPHRRCPRLRLHAERLPPTLADQAHFVLGQVASTRRDWNRVAVHAGAMTGAWTTATEHQRVTMGALIEQARIVKAGAYAGAEQIAQGRPHRLFWDGLFWLCLAVAVVIGGGALGAGVTALRRYASRRRFSSAYNP